MITSPQEYNSLLHSLTNPNEFMQYIQIPEEEKIYKIDLNSRTAEAPDFLAVTDEAILLSKFGASPKSFPFSVSLKSPKLFVCLSGFAQTVSRKIIRM